MLVRVAHPRCHPGTIIATFDPDGTYGNHTDGRSHVAVLLEYNSAGLWCLDQWVGQPVHERLIQFRDGGAKPVNDADQYYTVELRE